MELGELNIHIGDGNYSSKYPKNSEFLEDGVPFISASDFQGRVFIADGMKHISVEQHSVLLKGHLKPRDILVVVRGNGCGKVGFVPAEYDNANINAQLALLRCDNQTVNSEYLYYLLSTNEYQNKLKALCSGSAQPQLPIKSLKKLQLELPKYEMQLKIAGVAKIIDDKMLNNAAINRNLSEQMLAVYCDAVDENIWKEGSLDSVIEFYDSMRKPLSSRQRDGMEKKFPYYGATTIVDYVEDFLFEGLYILISEDGANVVDEKGIPLTQYTDGKFWVNNHAHIVKGKNGYSEALVLILLKNTNMQSIVTGAAQPKINQANLKGFKCLLPDEKSVSDLNSILEPMLMTMISNDRENIRLMDMRDSLLPKLMSGELDISNLDI